jgi:hypothetical protein
MDVAVTALSIQPFTEPSAVAPDAGVYIGNKPRPYSLILRLTLASGATALGSVLTVSFHEPSMAQCLVLIKLNHHLIFEVGCTHHLFLMFEWTANREYAKRA